MTSKAKRRDPIVKTMTTLQCALVKFIGIGLFTGFSLMLVFLCTDSRVQDFDQDFAILLRERHIS